MVTGRVTDATSGKGILNADLVVYDRYANPLRTDTRSDTNGAYAIGKALPAGLPIFVEARAPGYKKFRKRYVPDPVSSNVVADAVLERLPLPTFGTITLNRKGVFIPGLKKSGSESNYFAASADAALTGTWTTDVILATVTNTVEDFDDPGGLLAGPITNVYVDQIGEVWIIDPRAYTTAVLSASDGIPIPIPSSTNTYLRNRSILNAISEGMAPNVFHQRVMGPSAIISATNMLFSNPFKLWELPPGEFDPIWVMFTKGGAMMVNTGLVYGAGEQLSGLPLPPWLGTFSDLMGVIGSINPSSEYLNGVAPKGLVNPEPAFRAVIELVSGDPEYLHYNYGFDVCWLQGMNAPEGGFLTLAPSIIGLQFADKINLDIDGKTAIAKLISDLDFQVSNVDLSSMLPKPALDAIAAMEALRGKESASKVLEVSGSFRVRNKSTTAQKYKSASPDDFLFFTSTNVIGGGFAVDVDVDLTPFIGKIPYVGAFVEGMNKLIDFEIRAIMDGGIGMARSEIKWETKYPPSRETGSVFPPDPTPQTFRRNFMGGMNEDQVENILCFRYGSGLKFVASKFIKASAQGKIALRGNVCGETQPKPGLAVIFNESYSDSPFLKRIDGSIGLELEASVTVALVQFGYRENFEGIPLKYSWETDPLFALIPIGTSRYEISPLTHSNTTFNGEGPVLVDHFYPSGNLTASSQGGDILLFTDVVPGTGMTVSVSVPSGGSWDTPVPLVTAGGILAADIVPLPAGGWIVAWSEISAADLGNPDATSTIKYSTSDASGTIWSPPMTIEAVSGTVPGIFLVKSGGFVGLTYLESDTGPYADAFDIKSTTYSAGIWSGTSVLETNLYIQDFDALGTDAGATTRVAVAYTLANSNLVGRTWDGVTFSPESILTNQAAGALGIAADSTGTFHVAYAGDPFGIRFFIEMEGAGWGDLDTEFIGALADDIDLEVLIDGTNEIVLTAWSSGGDPTAVWYGYASLTGGVDRTASNLTQNLSGIYDHIEILSSTNWDAWILSSYHTTSNSSIRQFFVSYTNSAQGNDVDGDGFNDLLELIIVDADPFDSVTSITNVSPDGDFDMDGIGNFAEFYLNLDPTDEASTLELYILSATNDASLLFASATSITYKVQATTNILDTNTWITIRTLPGDGFGINLLDTNTPPKRGYYRLEVDIPTPSP